MNKASMNKEERKLTSLVKKIVLENWMNEAWTDGKWKEARKEWEETRRRMLDPNLEDCVRMWERIQNKNDYFKALMYVQILANNGRLHGHFTQWAYFNKREEMANFLRDRYKIIICDCWGDAYRLIKECQKYNIQYEKVSECEKGKGIELIKLTD